MNKKASQLAWEVIASLVERDEDTCKLCDGENKNHFITCPVLRAHAAHQLHEEEREAAAKQREERMWYRRFRFWS